MRFHLVNIMNLGKSKNIDAGISTHICRVYITETIKKLAFCMTRENTKGTGSEFYFICIKAVNEVNAYLAFWNINGIICILFEITFLLTLDVPT